MGLKQPSDEKLPCSVFGGCSLEDAKHEIIQKMAEKIPKIIEGK